jgi:hypothetical protein
MVADAYATFTILPRPRDLPPRTDDGVASDDRVRAVSLHFIKKGNYLLVSYLNHGIVLVPCPDVPELANSHLLQVLGHNLSDATFSNDSGPRPPVYVRRSGVITGILDDNFHITADPPL